MSTSFVSSNMFKTYKSDEFKYFFDKRTGFTITYGINKDHDPDYAPFPMIADIEITERCSGPGNNGNDFNMLDNSVKTELVGSGPCKFCYKANTANSGSVMSLELFKQVCDKLPRELTQIAFGTDAKLESNVEWYEIFKYARKSSFIPNVTVADVTEETAKKLASVCGAVAVSRYVNKNWCYNSIYRLNNAGLKIVNMHILLSKETLPWILETFEDFSTDPRLKGLTAIVLLSLKKKGRGVGFTRCTDEDFKMLVNKAFELQIPLGMDSCSAHKAMNAYKDFENYDKIKQSIEPCESSIFSSYINARGEYFPCSFTEGIEDWKTGLDVANCNNFIDDIWNHPKTILFRELLLSNKRQCPIYNV